MVSTPTTFAAARASVLRDGRQRNLSPRTLESYDQILARIGRELPSDVPLGAFDLELCRAWLDERAALRPATRANYTRTIKVFGHWCAGEYGIADPLDRLRVPQIPMPEIVPFGDDHLERLFASAAPYLAYAFVLLLETGLRSSEATALDLIDLTEERVLVRHPKGLRERVVEPPWV